MKISTRGRLRCVGFLLAWLPIAAAEWAGAAAPAVGSPSPRIAIVGDTLVVEGTAKDDRILIKATRRADTVRVVLNGVNLGPHGPVAKIVVHAGDGNDTVLVDPEVELPTEIHGGPGNDHLQGGSGPDLVFGEDGDDLLVGTRGRDALDAGQGRNRLVVREPMGRIHVSPSAAGDVLRILSGAYTLRPLSIERHKGQRHPSAREIGPIIVGGADLRDRDIVKLLRTSYQAGHTIALANASADDAELARSLLGHKSSGSWDASIPQADLVAFRRATRTDGRTHESAGVLLPRQVVPSTRAEHVTGERRADNGAIEWLSRVFSGTPVLPDPTPGDSPENNLINLANSYESSAIATDTNGDETQIVNWVWSARSFQDQQDLYYVLQEVDFRLGPNTSIREDDGSLTMLQHPPACTTSGVPVPSTVAQTSPETTEATTSYTTSLSYTIGGSVGWNQMQGLNALTSGSVTVANSKTVTVPPIQITNQTDFSMGTTAWEYHTNNTQASDTALSFTNQWVWLVPFSAYTDSQQSLSFLSGTNLGTSSVGLLGGQLCSTVPFPFGRTFDLQQPMVNSVSPTTVFGGDEFTITGSGLYPSLVTGVLIDGEPLATTQFSTVSDTEITVVAPDTLGFFLPIVVQTSQGVSNDNVTIEILGIPSSPDGRKETQASRMSPPP